MILFYRFSIQFYLLLHFSVIRKHFTENPYSRSVELERQVELRCLAPEGIPPPDVTWQKNGVPVEPKREGSNLIVSSEGHLLVVQARLADMGNYTCVSENVAGKRVSDTAILTVLGTYLLTLIFFFLPVSQLMENMFKEIIRRCRR